ncbi:MAG: DUF2238 domain-containing protein [Planctomycetia bacterium]|nr:DUF2238 domain-containing protein [Planctomycetia bacterium]
MAGRNDQRHASLWGVGAFTLLYLAIAVVTAWTIGNAEFAIYIGVMFLLIALVGLVHWRIGLSTPVLWGLSLWGLAHMCGGLVRVPESWPIEGENHVLYSLWLIPGRLKYDQVVHAFGFFVTTWVCWQSLQAILAARTGQPRRSITPSPGMLVLCAAAGMGFGALNEVIEFAATLMVPETNVGGYQNTGWDLVSNMVGSVLAAAAIGARGRYSTRS